MSAPTQGRVPAGDLRLPASQVRSSCGFCEATHGQPAGVCYDAGGHCRGTCYGAVLALTLAVAMAKLSGRGLFDSGEAVGLPPAAGAQAVPERYAHRLGDLSPHPRRQVIPAPATIANCAAGT